MTSEQFNDKWKEHLETGHYGMDIEIPKVIDYMDREFTKVNALNPGFTYSQIKLKFGMSRVYTNCSGAEESGWESDIDLIIKEIAIKAIKSINR